MKEIEEMKVVRTGKNPSNPRPSGTSKNARDKRNAAKKESRKKSNTMVDFEFESSDNVVSAKSVANKKSLVGLSKMHSSPKGDRVNRNSFGGQMSYSNDKGSIISGSDTYN